MKAQRAPVVDNSTATVKVREACGIADSGMRKWSMEQGFQTLESNMSSGKGVEGDRCDARGSDNNTKTCLGKRSVKSKVNSLKADWLDDCLGLHLQKQKRLNQGLDQRHKGHSPPLSMDLQNSASSTSDMNPRPSNSSDDLLAAESDSANLVNFICAFCQTWKMTEGSGPMQHFANGKQVFGIEAGHSNVIHVHKSCFEWLIMSSSYRFCSHLS